jgi:hypothetical protein
MRRRVLLRAALSLGVSRAPMAFARPLAAPRQRALIIGNAAYRSVARLVNPAHDARLVASSLQRLGVACTCLTDCTNARMAGSIDTFVRALRVDPVDLVWFYFSGHGAYVGGHNLMLGIDTVPSSPQSLLAQGFDLDALRGMLDQVHPGAALLVEDACRNNPFMQAAASATRGIDVNPGLVPRRWGGTLTAYSTAPFTEALDWPDRAHGPYATALAGALLHGGAQPIEAVFRRVADTVWRSTHHRQQPGYYSELRDDVWLRGHTLQVQRGTGLGVRPDDARTGRAVGTRHYQAGIGAPAPIGTPEQWDDAMRELVATGQSLDAADAQRAIDQGRRAGASLRRQTLAAMMLEARGPDTVALDQAEALFQRAAHDGYVPAQVFLGELAYRRKRYALAYAWLNQAAIAGSTRAVLDVNNMLIDGAGAPHPASLRDAMREFQQRQAEMERNLSRLLPRPGE